jgi:signal transduction histidine kinase
MLRRLFTRVRELDELKGDALLAAAFAVAAIVESFLVKSAGHSRPVTAVVAAAIGVPLIWRRRHTLSAIVGLTAILAVATPQDTYLVDHLTTPFIAVLVFAYTAGRHEATRRMYFELALLSGVIAAVGGISRPSDVFWTAVVIGLPALAGRGIRSRVRLQQEMREKTRRLEAERELGAHQAVEDERSRIASELQAVVANGVSAMVIQAEAVPRLFDIGERAAATHALAVIEETGRDALAEMRRLLGVLRRDADGPALAPQPSLARADALVSRMEGRGLAAAIHVQGKPVTLAPGVDLAGYRVLQEALSSSTQAPGVSHADVSILYGEDNVLVKVRDDRESSDGPDADVLRALRERVGLYGGVLRAAPRQDARGFEVEVRLPIGDQR